MAGGTWLRSDYDIVGREVKEFDDHSGTYVVVTIKYGDKKITAECGSTWTTETGEDLPSTPVLYDKCRDLPMGSVTLDRTDWNSLYYFSGSGKHREDVPGTVATVVGRLKRALRMERRSTLEESDQEPCKDDS
jgi:hypothetical protein